MNIDDYRQLAVGGEVEKMKAKPIQPGDTFVNAHQKQITVLGVESRDGRSRQLKYHVRCHCGRECVMWQSSVRRGGSCPECTARHRARWGAGGYA